MVGSGSSSLLKKMMPEHLPCPTCNGELESELSIFWAKKVAISFI